MDDFFLYLIYFATITAISHDTSPGQRNSIESSFK